MPQFGSGSFRHSRYGFGPAEGDSLSLSFARA